MSEISTYIQTAVRKNKFPLDYFYIGIVFSILIGCKEFKSITFLDID